MKQLLVYFEDRDFKELQKRKGKKTWRAFILEALQDKKNELP